MVDIQNTRLKLETLRFWAKEHLKKAESVHLEAQHILKELNTISEEVAKYVESMGAVNATDKPEEK